MTARKSQLAIIFFTVFLYLVGFGVIIPIIPVLAKDMGATGFEVGLLLSVYSLMQFIFAPFWGRLSDRYGRRPILLFCLVGECLSYIGFGISQNLTGLFIARMFAGFFGASISTASAYISDITAANERSKGMALIGVAFGLGFLVGPAIGGGLTVVGGTSFAAYCVAGLCILNFFFGLKFLKESLDPAHRNVEPTEKMGRFKKLFRYIKLPLVGPLIFVFFLSSIAMSTMEATLVLLVGDRFDWGVKEVSFGFAYIGFIMILSQGFLVRRLLPIVGEKKLLVFGLSCMAIGLSMITFSHEIWLLAISQTILAVGFACTSPSILGSVSLLTSPKEQGEVLGTTQGTASLGRILGPALGGWLYQNVAKGTPFVTGGAFALLALLVVISVFAKLPETAKA